MKRKAPPTADAVVQQVRYGHNTCMSFNRHGTMLACGLQDGRVTLWEYETMSLILEWNDLCSLQDQCTEGERKVAAAAATAAADTAVSNHSTESQIQAHEMAAQEAKEKEKRQRRKKSQSAAVRAVPPRTVLGISWTKNGRYLLAFTRSAIAVWSVADSVLAHSFSVAPGQHIRDCSLDPSCSRMQCYIVYANQGLGVCMLDLVTQVPRFLLTDRQCLSLSFHTTLANILIVAAPQLQAATYGELLYFDLVTEKVTYSELMRRSLASVSSRVLTSSTGHVALNLARSLQLSADSGGTSFQDVVDPCTWDDCAIDAHGGLFLGVMTRLKDRSYGIYVWNAIDGALLKIVTGTGSCSSILHHPTHGAEFITLDSMRGVFNIWQRVRLTSNIHVFPPGFEVIPFNVDYVEREDEFDHPPKKKEKKKKETDSVPFAYCLEEIDALLDGEAVSIGHDELVLSPVDNELRHLPVVTVPEGEENMAVLTSIIRPTYHQINPGCNTNPHLLIQAQSHEFRKRKSIHK